MSDPLVLPLSIVQDTTGAAATFTLRLPQSTVIVSFARDIDTQGRRELCCLLDQLLPLMRRIWSTPPDDWDVLDMRRP